MSNTWQKCVSIKVSAKHKRSRPGRESFKFDILKCVHLVDLNNPRIVMTYDKMAVAANIGAQTVLSFQTRMTAGSVVYLY